MTLTKAELVRRIHQQHDLSREEAVAVVDNFLDIAKDTLGRGEDLLLSGFGKFNVRQKKARRGRNPQTGEELTLSPRKVITFKASGILRQRINGD